MGVDLAVDELKATPCVGDLFAEAGCQLGEQVAVFAGGGLRFEMQLSEFAAE
jgi:hypothetical protein